MFLAPVYALRAYAHYVLGNLDLARSDFTEALSLSETLQFTSWLTDGLCDFKTLLEYLGTQHKLSSKFLSHVHLLINASQYAYPLTLKKPVLLLIEKLSNREREVLLMILQHKSNTDIAKQLCISQNTLKTHIRHLYQKLGIKNRKMLKEQIPFEFITDKFESLG